MIQKIHKSSELRSALPLGDTDACRLVDGAGDGLPGIYLDTYAGRYLFSTEAPAAPPELRNWASARPHLSTYWKRLDQRDKESPFHLGGPRQDGPFEIREQGVQFLVSLQAGYSQGIFLDQRENRARVRARCRPGDTILNTFAYTGAFSVYAALGGGLHDNPGPFPTLPRLGPGKPQSQWPRSHLPPFLQGRHLPLAAALFKTGTTLQRPHSGPPHLFPGRPRQGVPCGARLRIAGRACFRMPCARRLASVHDQLPTPPGSRLRPHGFVRTSPGGPPSEPSHAPGLYRRSLPQDSLRRNLTLRTGLPEARILRKSSLEGRSLLELGFLFLREFDIRLRKLVKPEAEPVTHVHPLDAFPDVLRS